jgi:hypothetical protein
MSLDPELSQGFWQQDKAFAQPAMTTAQRYGLYPSPPRVSLSATGQEVVEPEKVGRLRQGGYARCGTLEGLCGPVDPVSGTQLPYVPCQPPDLLYNCYYKGNPTPARSLQMATLSSEPFHDVMKTVYSQPNYGDAVQTFFAGNV